MYAAIGLDIGLPAALVLVLLTALAEQLNVVVGRRTRISLAGPFLVAAALVGGPLVGACAGAATATFTTGDPRRKRAVCAVARARRQAAPRARGRLARDRRELVPPGAAARRLPLPLPDGAWARARVRRRSAARRRLGEPAAAPPRADPRSRTGGGAGRRADGRAESLRARGGAHLRAGADQARWTH